MNAQSKTKDVENCTIPKCEVYEFGKAHLWPRKSRKMARIPDKEIYLNKD